MKRCKVNNVQKQQHKGKVCIGCGKLNTFYIPFVRKINDKARRISNKKPYRNVYISEVFQKLQNFMKKC